MKEKRHEVHLQNEQRCPTLVCHVMPRQANSKLFIYHQGHRTYEHTMKEVMSNLGNGKFDIFLDDSHKEHKISAESLKVVFKYEGL